MIHFAGQGLWGDHRLLHLRGRVPARCILHVAKPAAVGNACLPKHSGQPAVDLTYCPAMPENQARVSAPPGKTAMTHGPRSRRVVAAVMCAVVAWLPLPQAAGGKCACNEPCQKRCCGTPGCCCPCTARGALEEESLASTAGFRSCCHGRQAERGHVSIRASTEGAADFSVPNASVAVEPQLASAGCQCACCAQTPLPAMPPVPQQLSKLEAGAWPAPHLPCCSEGAASLSRLAGQVSALHGRSLHVLLCVWRD